MGLGLGKVGRAVEGRDAGGVAGVSVAEGRAGGSAGSGVRWWWLCVSVSVCVCRCSLVLRVLMCWVSLLEAQKLQRNNAIFGDGLRNLRSGNRADKGTLCVLKHVGVDVVLLQLLV